MLNEVNSKSVPNLQIDHLDSTVAYADGAEDELVSIIERAVDRSSTSDELASCIHDWPTRYHLSPLRAHLLAPLRFQPDARILEIGCGTGINVRVLAERGHTVTGLEGQHQRALAARLRNAEFADVEIVAGDIADYQPEGTFDVVLVIGVLEYTPSGMGSIGGPQAFLERCRSLLKPDGVMVLAIENQLGLKYLLSYPEDHLGVPWVGIEGYRPGTPRTWSRARLREMLSESGFPEQQWLHPFPDYKLPTFICREEMYADEDGRHLLSQFIRQPVIDYSGSPWMVCDAQRAHQEMIQAGLGPDVSNSFLVVASASSSSCEEAVGRADAWMVSGQRRGAFRSARELVRSQDEWLLVQTSGPSADRPARRSWLSNRGHSDQSVVQGTPLDDLIALAIEAEDREELSSLVRSYWDFLEQRLDSGEADRSTDLNPFVLEGETQFVPGDLLDCVPQNLLVDEAGRMHSVDHEWVAEGRCSLQLIFLRGLLVTAWRLHQRGASLLFAAMADSTVADLVGSLAAIGGVPVPSNALDALVHAEYELQSIVAVAPIGDEATYRATVMDTKPAVSHRPSLLGLMRRADQRDRLAGELAGLVGDRDRLAGELAGLVGDRDRLAGELAGLVGDRDRLAGELATVHHGADHLRLEIDALRRSRTYRVGRLIVGPFTLLTRPFRR